MNHTHDVQTQTMPLSNPLSQLDSGLACLVMMGQQHGLSADPSQLEYKFGRSDDPLEQREIIRAAKWLGLKGKRIRSRWSRLIEDQLPAIAHLHGGQFVLLTEKEKDQVVLSDPRLKQPVTVKRTVFERLWTGDLVVMSLRTNVFADAFKFDLSRFKRASKDTESDQNVDMPQTENSMADASAPDPDLADVPAVDLGAETSQQSESKSPFGAKLKAKLRPRNLFSRAKANSDTVSPDQDPGTPVDDSDQEAPQSSRLKGLLSVDFKSRFKSTKLFSRGKTESGADPHPQDLNPEPEELDTGPTRQSKLKAFFTAGFKPNIRLFGLGAGK